MQIGITGLGRMGANMSLRLLDHGHRPVVFDLPRDGRRARPGRWMRTRGSSETP